MQSYTTMSCRIPCILLLVLLLIGCGSGDDLPSAIQPGDDPTTPTIPLSVVHVCAYQIPRVVVFPPITSGSDENLFEAKLFHWLLCETNITPQPFVDIASYDLVVTRIMAGNSQLFRPTDQYSATELTRFARAWDAQRYVIPEYSRDGEQFRLALRVYDMANASEIWKWHAEGSWAQVDQLLVDALPDFLKALGSDPAATIPTHLNFSYLGAFDEYRQLARVWFDQDLTPSDEETERVRTTWIASFSTRSPYADCIDRISSFRNGQADGSDLIKQLAAQDPLDAELARQVAYQYQWKKNHPQARAVFELVARTYPNYLTALEDYGYAFYQGGHYEQALQVQKRMERVSPDNVMTHLLAGDIHARIGGSQLEGGPISEERAEILYESYTAATDHYEHAVSLAPHDYYSVKELANIRRNQRQPAADILSLYEQALTLNPANLGGLEGILWLCAQGYSDQPATGLSYWDKYKSEVKEPLLAQRLLKPLTHNIMGKAGVTDDDYTRLMDEQTLRARELVDLYLLALEGYVDADPAIQQQMDYNFQNIMSCAALAYLPVERTDIIRKYMDHKQFAIDQCGIFYSGCLLMRTGEYQEAYQYLARSLGHNDWIDQQAPPLMAVCLAHMGRVDDALAALDDTASRNPPRMNTYYPDMCRVEILRVGNAEQRAQALPLARETFEKHYFNATFILLLEVLAETGHEQEACDLIVEHGGKRHFPRGPYDHVWQKVKHLAPAQPEITDEQLPSPMPGPEPNPIKPAGGEL